MSATRTSPACTLFMSARERITRAWPAPIFWPMARPSTSTLPRSPSWKRSSVVAVERDFTVSGRACTMYSLPVLPSFAHSMSIGRW